MLYEGSFSGLGFPVPAPQLAGLSQPLGDSFPIRSAPFRVSSLALESGPYPCPYPYPIASPVAQIADSIIMLNFSLQHQHPVLDNL